MSKTLTPWFSGDVDPVRPGVYEVFWAYKPVYARYEDGFWRAGCGRDLDAAANNAGSSACAPIRWRGLAEKPNEIDDFEVNVSRLFIKPADRQGRILHAAVGIAGEAGEILDSVKKAWIYGKAEDPENILEECGDALFYIVALLQQYGFTLADAMGANVAKLWKRYPDGYSDADAINRKDKIDGVR